MWGEKNFFVNRIDVQILILGHNFLIILNQRNAFLLETIHEQIHLFLCLILHLDNLEYELNVFHLVASLNGLHGELGDGMGNHLQYRGTYTAVLLLRAACVRNTHL